MSRATQATINLAALQHNLNRARQAAPDRRIIAVIKADGYGHGMVRVAKALKDADAFGVASLEEALELRNKGIRQPIVLLEGVFESSEITKAGLQYLELVIHHISQLEMLEHVAKTASVSTSKITVWLKIDTGMHRLGFPASIVKTVYDRLDAISLVKEIHIMSHLANADDPADKYTAKQIDSFNKATTGIAGIRSLANSAGILAWPDTHFDAIRPGIMLYGVSPIHNKTAQELDLKPVMTFSSQLIAINFHRKGEKIGYGGAYTCPEDMSVGVVAAGYGDGYPRHAKIGTPVLVNDERVPLIGRVSMDMICVDLRTQPNAKVGDSVVLWGEQLPVEEIAGCATTIAYELLCSVTKRVKFVES